MPRRLAIVPPAPALISGLASDLPPQLDPVLAACDRAVAATAAGEPEVTILAVAERPRDLSWRPAQAEPTVRLEPAAVAAGSTGAVPPLGWLVADHLLDRVGFTGVRRRRLVPSAALPEGNLLVMADGSAARGDRSPRPGAPGREFDDELVAAVRRPDEHRLTRIDDTSAARVGCGTAAVWRALASVAAKAEGEQLDVLHPLGVTYVIAVWRLGA